MNNEESSSSSSEEEPKAKGKKVNKKKGLSIAEFLARKEDVQVAKIRVCIVQQEDTLQRIAERYEVSVQQLLNLNHLGIDQEVSEGQVLYVPAAVQAKGSS
jgi:stage VI sporulation protein D